MPTSLVRVAGHTLGGDKGCFTCDHVMEGAPVLLVVHDTNGDLQFMCGSPDHDFDSIGPRYVHVSHLLEWQPDLLMLPPLDLGFEAERADVNSPWVVSDIPPYD